MRKSTKIDRISSLEKLEYIKEHVCNADKNRITAAVLSINDSKKLSSLVAVFSQSANIFCEENADLKDIIEDYKKYATEYSGDVQKVYDALISIKQQIFYLYDLLKSTTPKERRRHGYPPVDTTSIMYIASHSILGGSAYTPLFFESDNLLHNRLISEISDFLGYLACNLDLCQKAIADEAQTRENSQECVRLLMNQIDEIYAYGIENCQAKKKRSSKELDYVCDLVAVQEHPENAQKWYHKLKPKDLTVVAVCMQDSALSKYPSAIRKAYSDNVAQMEKFDKVMSHLIHSASKPTGELMVFVMKYTGCNMERSKFYRCFVDTYNQKNGTFKCISIQQFYSAFTGSYTSGNEKYSRFKEKMDFYCNIAS